MKLVRQEPKLTKTLSDIPRPSRKLSQVPQLPPDTQTKTTPQVSPTVTKESGSNIKVIARFRPKNDTETQLEATKPPICKHLDEASIQIGEETVTFDRIFDVNATQEEVFQAVGKPVVDDVLAGYNGTVVAYGQTGSGKTFTMMGVDVYEEKLRGLIPRAASAIFAQVNEADSEVEFVLRCSMLEIYKETLRDLLCPDSADLRIKEDPSRGIYVQGITEVFVTTEDEMLEVIEIGEQMRTVSATKCNAVSSRSHQLFVMEVKQRFPNDSEKRGMLNLVDLAGSEKVNHSGVTGNSLQETKKINLSLSALGNVIHALTSNSDHIPYRDSKLTRLLQESLGGNFKTTLLVALSPCNRHFDETFNSIKFAQRAKRIKNRVSMNIKNSREAYKLIIDKLTEELRVTQAELQYWKRPRGIGFEITPAGSADVSVSTGGEVETTPSDSSKKRPPIPIPLHDLQIDAENTAKQMLKIQSLESEKRDISEKVTELEQKAQSLQKKLLKEEKQAHEYYTLYHQTTKLMHKESDDSVLMKKQNEGLTEQVKKLGKALEDLDDKFCRVLEETQHQGSNTMMEFENWDEDTGDHNQVTTVYEESQLPAPTRPLPSLSTEESTHRRYFSAVQVQMNPDSALSKDSQIRQLQNQLLQAHLVNCNLSRALRVYTWKNSLLLHKYTMKSMFAKHQTKRVKGLEEMLDHLQDSYNGICSLIDKIQVESTKTSVAEQPATPRSKVMRPLIRSSSSRRLMGGNKSGVQEHAPGRDRSSVIWDRLDKSHSYLDPESQELSLCSKFKSVETNLRQQQSMNLQLKEALSEITEESRKAKKMAEEIEAQMQKDQKDEYTRWSEYISEYKRVTEGYLTEKEKECEKLNEVLSLWVDRYIQLQELLSRGDPAAAHAIDTVNDLKRLCGWTHGTIQKLRECKPLCPHVKSPMRRRRPCAPPPASIVRAGSGDVSPDVSDVE